MLEFDEIFFREEERCGFTVPKMMKKAWAVELELAQMLIDICRQHNLRLYASWGTLLGAVRHNGFIPWDDDIDFDMPRQDFMKLADLIRNKTINGDFYFSSLYTPGTHCQPSATLMNYMQVPVPKAIQSRFYDFPFVAGIDINPMDYVPDNKEFAETQFQLYNMLYDLAQRFWVFQKEGTLESYVVQAEELCNTRFVRDDTLRRQIWRCAEQVAALAAPQEASCYTEMGRRVRGQMDYLLPFAWFETVEWFEFENIKVPVPGGYDGILKLNYGEYKVPQYHGSAHDYPFYKKQEEYLRSRGLL